LKENEAEMYESVVNIKSRRGSGYFLNAMNLIDFGIQNTNRSVELETDPRISTMGESQEIAIDFKRKDVTNENPDPLTDERAFGQNFEFKRSKGD